MKVVVDTNVLLSSLMNPSSPPAQIRFLIFSRTLQICLSQTLLSEIENVLRRPSVRKYIRRSDEEIEQFLRLIVSEAIWVSATGLEFPISRDPKDDHVLATALAAGAEAIVTGDQDLLVLGSFQGIVILTPAQLVERFAP